MGDSECITEVPGPLVYAASRQQSADGSLKNMSPPGPPVHAASRRPAVPHFPSEKAISSSHKSLNGSSHFFG